MFRSRVSARLAWRDITQAKGRSGLILALVAMPVLIVVVVAVSAWSLAPTPEQRTRAIMGQAVAMLAPLHGADGTCLQASTPGWPACASADSTGAPIDGRAALATHVPRGAVTEGRRSVNVEVGELGGAPTLVTIDTTAPIVQGTWRASAVPGADEVLADAGFMRLYQVGVGDDVTVGAATFRIVGTARSLIARASGLGTDDGGMLVVGPGHPLASPEVDRVYLAVAPDPVQVEALNRAGVGVITAASWEGWSTGAPGETSLAALMLGLEVLACLLTGSIVAAAMTIGMRRQARTFALLRASGASSRSISGLVWWTGGLFGLVGSAMGVLGGLGAAALGVWAADRAGLIVSFGINIPWLTIGACAAVGCVVTAAVAWIPARSVLRQDALASLRQASTASRPPRRTWVGIVLLVLGCGLLAPAAVMVSRDAGGGPQYQRGMLVAIAASVLAAAGLLVVAARVLHSVALRGRGPLALRLAVRDADRSRGRTMAVVAGSASAVVLALVPLLAIGSFQAIVVRDYYPPLPPGVVAVSDPAGDGAATQVVTKVLGAPAESVSVPGLWPEAEGGWRIQERDACTRDVRGGCIVHAEPDGVVSSPDYLRFWLGAKASEAQRVIDAGGIVVFQSVLLRADGTVLLASESGQKSLPGFFAGDQPGARPAMSAATGRQFGWAEQPGGPTWLRYGAVPTSDQLAVVRGTLTRTTGNDWMVRAAFVPNPAGDAFIWFTCIGILLASLISGIGVALAVRDASASRIALATTGATRSTLRRTSALQALVLVGCGVLIGGLAALPPLAVIGAIADIPLGLLPWAHVAAVVVVPVVVIAAGTMVLTRPPVARVIRQD